MTRPGVSVIEDGRVDSVRAVGNLANLRAAIEEHAEDGGGVAVAAPPATTGVAHTRWATHGRVTEENAHPHSDSSDRVHIVLNGIVENHAKLRRRLEGEGQEFSSETDAEVVAHLIASPLRRRPRRRRPRRLRRAARPLRLRRHARRRSPGLLVGARKECPLVAGVGEGESFLASAIPAFLAETRAGGADRKRRDRHHRRLRGDGSPTPTATRSSARPRRSPGTRRPPRRAATRPSC